MEKNPKGRSAQSDFRTPCEILAHPVGTPCESLAHPAKFWHTLPNFGIPCEIDDFALRNALFSSILLLIALPTPFQVWQGVLKCSKARILHVIDLQLALP